MNRFLKLTSCVINTSHIVTITPHLHKYYIHMNPPTINGFMLFSFGTIDTNETIIKICEKENKIDYDNITEFIKEIK